MQCLSRTPWLNFFGIHTQGPALACLTKQVRIVLVIRMVNFCQQVFKPLDFYTRVFLYYFRDSVSPFFFCLVPLTVKSLRIVSYTAFLRVAGNASWEEALRDDKIIRLSGFSIANTLHGPHIC